MVPWINKTIKSAKSQRRKAERKWRELRKPNNFEHYKKCRNKVTSLIVQAKREYYCSKIELESGDSKALFKTAKGLMTHKKWRIDLKLISLRRYRTSGRW